MALATWLERQLKAHNLSQNAAARRAGVSITTINDILNKGHIPKIDVLFKLADLFDTGRVDVLFLTGHLRTGGQARVTGADPLELELLQRFRRLPDEWKEVAIDQIALLGRLADLPPGRTVAEGDREAKEFLSS